jgi:hypothetical protein
VNPDDDGMRVSVGLGLDPGVQEVLMTAVVVAAFTTARCLAGDLSIAM